MAVTELLIQSTLKVCIDPNTGKDFISSKSAKNIQINGSEVSLDIVLGYPAKSVMAEVQNLVSETLAALPRCKQSHGQYWQPHSRTQSPTRRDAITQCQKHHRRCLW